MNQTETLIEALAKILKNVGANRSHELILKFRVYTNDKGDYLNLYTPDKVEITYYGWGDIKISVPFTKDCADFPDYKALVAQVVSFSEAVPTIDRDTQKARIADRIKTLKEELTGLEKTQNEI